MPYKDIEKRRKLAKEGMQKLRKIVNPAVVNPSISPSVNPAKKPSTVPTYFKDGVEMVAAEGILPERPRYHVCTDGQIMDRANPPKADLSKMSPRRKEDFRAWAHAPEFVPLNPKGNRTVLRSLMQPK